MAGRIGKQMQGRAAAAFGILDHDGGQRRVACEQAVERSDVALLERRGEGCGVGLVAS
jgi:hypothetical protein